MVRQKINYPDLRREWRPPRGRRRLDRTNGRTRALNPAGEHIDRRHVLLIANADILEALRVSSSFRRWEMLEARRPPAMASQVNGTQSVFSLAARRDDVGEGETVAAVPVD